MEQNVDATKAGSGPLVRPNFTQRANRRFPYVLALFLIINLVTVLSSGVTGWAILGAFLRSAYGTVIAAAIVTLLLALIPGKPRQAS